MLKQPLGGSSLLHGFQPCMHASLAASRSIAVQDWGMAHLVEESTQTAKLSVGIVDIISTE